jgi:hypothetical protein
LRVVGAPWAVGRPDSKQSGKRGAGYGAETRISPIGMCQLFTIGGAFRSSYHRMVMLHSAYRCKA